MGMRNEKLTVAIAGCHRMLNRKPGSHNFATAFCEVNETEVVAVFDLGLDTRTEFVSCWHDVWGDIPTYGDYSKMLEEIQPDIICIATRQTMHAEQSVLAAELGVRGIMCDKPLVTSLVEMDDLILACQNVPLLLALDRRWFERYVVLCDQISAGIIGEVKSIIAYGLPNLINHGCHWYDTLFALAGDVEPAWASGFVDDFSTEPEASRRRMDPSGRAQIGLSNGTVLYITSDGAYAGSGLPMSFEVIGDTGRLFVLNDAHQSFVWTSDSSDQVRLVELPQDATAWSAGPAMVRDLVQAIQTNSRTKCDVDQARRATEIGFAIHESSKALGAKVDLPVSDRLLRIESFPWGNE